MKFRVLFLCATNGVQSPMAEALLAMMDPEHFEAFSAGIERGEMHPLAVEVMKEIDIDLQGRPTRSIDDVQHLPFDVVITLCDRARFLGSKFAHAEVLHWRFDDPLLTSDRVRQKRMFRVLRDQITQRIRFFTLVYTRTAV